MKKIHQLGIKGLLLSWLLILSLLLGGCFGVRIPGANDASTNNTENTENTETENGAPSSAVTAFETLLNGERITIPAYEGKAYVSLADGTPRFTAQEITTECFEYYSELDALGRCGAVSACCGRAIMPPEGDERGSISSVRPSGWVQAQYDCVSGKNLYNRCHLIGWQLSDEDANKKNLITGTRYLNIDGMLPFENMVADYIRETGNHVMYRVTPVYIGNELVARGVVMEGYSVEDEGEAINFYVYCYNVQPGVAIHYATGESALDDGNASFTEEDATEPETNGASDSYVLNTNSKKIHRATCSYAADISEQNRQEHTGEIDTLLAAGYTACGSCLKGSYT